MIRPSQRSLTDNARQLQDTDISVHGGIRTRIPSKRAAADPRLSPCGHRDRHLTTIRVEPFFLPTDAHNVKKHRVIKTF